MPHNHIPRQTRLRAVGAAFCCVFLLTAAVPSSPAAGEGADDPWAGRAIRTVADLNGKRLGVIAGTILDTAANDALDYTQIVYFDGNEAEIRALVAGEIDAVIDDEPVVRYISGKYPVLQRVEGTLQDDHYGFATRYDDAELHNRIDSVIGEFLDDGTLRELEEKWIDNPDEASRVMPDPPEAGGGAVLRMGVSPVSAPFVYKNPDGELLGLDIELMGLVARRLDMRLEVVDMEFSELVPSLLDGRVDVIGSCLSITDGRAKLIWFTREYYRGGVAALVYVG